MKNKLKIIKLEKRINTLKLLLSNHILSIKFLPNPKYLLESNQREMIWSKEDALFYVILENEIAFLESQLNK